VPLKTNREKEGAKKKANSHKKPTCEGRRGRVVKKKKVLRKRRRREERRDKKGNPGIEFGKRSGGSCVGWHGVLLGPKKGDPQKSKKGKLKQNHGKNCKKRPNWVPKVPGGAARIKTNRASVKRQREKSRLKRDNHKNSRSWEGKEKPYKIK